jgi:hypothetical protein
VSEADNAPPKFADKLAGREELLGELGTPFRVIMMFIDPVPVTPMEAPSAVFPWSPDRVCPEVTGKLPVASINGIFPSLSKKLSNWALLLLFTNVVL